MALQFIYLLHTDRCIALALEVATGLGLLQFGIGLLQKRVLELNWSRQLKSTPTLIARIRALTCCVLPKKSAVEYRRAQTPTIAIKIHGFRFGIAIKAGMKKGRIVKFMAADEFVEWVASVRQRNSPHISKREFR